MTRESFQSWLEDYGRAWQQRDPRAAVELFTEDATYQETPFVEAIRGRQALHAYWANVCRTQEDVRFGFEVLAAGEAGGLAHWWASFVRLPRRNRIALDGIFLIQLNTENRCTALGEWWHRKDA